MIYHEGERAIHRRLGVGEAASALGGRVRDSLPAGPQLLLTTLPMIIIGASDADGRCWTSPLFGRPGFIRASPGSVRSLELPPPDDPIGPRRRGDALGMLAIDLNRALRYRINGRVLRWGPRLIEVKVREAYGNCPSYIQPADIQALAYSESIRSAGRLSSAQMAHIGRSNRMFVTTCHPTAGADVSHKGGPPGFVEVMSPDRLRFRDLPGNNMFNTLGNLLTNPSIGLLFQDFDRHTSLQITGIAQIIWDGDDRDVEIAISETVCRGF
ncbi:hypothetical protein GCM10022254_44840 [Actinomadura meridiana]|uniref:Pyridoxamine 5'-phosphate oxidase N-terminal domain-containing protein n=1 Tax=Actinomadura meridiana TaxID=559626 RepID=A0ABP8C9N7_9ACTN